MGAYQKASRASGATGYLLIERRVGFCFGEREGGEKDEEAHIVVVRGAHVGVDDVARRSGVRQAGPDGPARERLYHHVPGELDQLSGGV